MTEARTELLEQLRALDDELATIRARLDEIEQLAKWQYDGEVNDDVLEALDELENAFDTFAEAIENAQDAIEDTEE